MNAYNYQIEWGTQGRGEHGGCGDVYPLAKTFL